MKDFSREWIRSRQPRKQRKYRYHAPLHLRQKMTGAHLAKGLIKEYKKRSMPLRKGDEVLVMRGAFRGKSGKVTDIDLKRLKAFIDVAKRKKVSGEEVQVPIEPSKLMITKLNLEDSERKKVLERKVVR